MTYSIKCAKGHKKVIPENLNYGVCECFNFCLGGPLVLIGTTEVNPDFQAKSKISGKILNLGITKNYDDHLYTMSEREEWQVSAYPSSRGLGFGLGRAEQG